MPHSGPPVGGCYGHCDGPALGVFVTATTSSSKLAIWGQVLAALVGLLPDVIRWLLERSEASKDALIKKIADRQRGWERGDATDVFGG